MLYTDFSASRQTVLLAFPTGWPDATPATYWVIPPQEASIVTATRSMRLYALHSANRVSLEVLPPQIASRLSSSRWTPFGAHNQRYPSGCGLLSFILGRVTPLFTELLNVHNDVVKERNVRLPLRLSHRLLGLKGPFAGQSRVKNESTTPGSLRCIPRDSDSFQRPLSFFVRDCATLTSSGSLPGNRRCRQDSNLHFPVGARRRSLAGSHPS